MLSKDIKFNSFLTPGITKFNGITYVVPGWHKVPNETTLEEVINHWEKPKFKEEEKPKSLISEIVISKRTGEKYNVTFNGNYWSCTCLGFSFKRTCKHVDEIKSKVLCQK